jgi:hypothetical protein
MTECFGVFTDLKKRNGTGNLDELSARFIFRIPDCLCSLHHSSDLSWALEQSFASHAIGRFAFVDLLLAQALFALIKSSHGHCIRVVDSTTFSFSGQGEFF